MNEDGPSKVGSILKSIISFFIKKPMFAIPTLAGVGITVVFVGIIFIIIAAFASDSRNEMTREKSDTCSAESITFTGTVKGKNITLNAETEGGIKINGIKGNITGEDFTATLKTGNGLVEMPLPTSGGDPDVQTFMAYTAVTAKSSDQYKLLNSKGAKDVGIYRMVNDRYAIALGSFYGTKIGTKYTLEFKQKDGSTKTIQAILGDQKADQHTDSKHQYHAQDKSIVEFVTAAGTASNASQINKTQNQINEDFGEIVSIKKNDGQDVQLTGTIKLKEITIEGTINGETVEASGTVENGKIEATGLLGDTTGCDGENIGNGCGFSYPLKKMNISSYATNDRWGRPHCGDDYSTARGTNLYAIMDGTVVRTNNTCGNEGYYGNPCGGEWGNYIVIEHKNAYNGKTVYSNYAHMSKNSLKVKEGDTVEAGQLIGKSGNSGSTKGPHLHFELNYKAGSSWTSSGCHEATWYGKSGGVYNILKQLKKNSDNMCDNSQVIEYAKQFVGNAYLYGGNWDGEKPYSPTDCSGFVKGVYAHFGKDLPRSSSSMCSSSSKATRKISGKNSTKGAKPGDIICYSGHVGLYMGNNKILHASNAAPYPKGGVKISDMDYRSWNKIIRVK